MANQMVCRRYGDVRVGNSETDSGKPGQSNSSRGRILRARLNVMQYAGASIPLTKLIAPPVNCCILTNLHCYLLDNFIIRISAHREVLTNTHGLTPHKYDLRPTRLRAFSRWQVILMPGIDERL